MVEIANISQWKCALTMTAMVKSSAVILLYYVYNLFCFHCECTQIKADLYPVIINKTISVSSWFCWYKETVEVIALELTHTLFLLLIVYIEHLTFKMITKCYKHDHVSLYTQNTSALLNHHQCAASTWMMWRLPQNNGTSALTKHQLQVERRESHRANQVYALTTHQLQVERRESHRANQVYALTTHQLQVERRERHRANQVYALTTHQLQVERRQSHRANQVYALTTHQLQVERRESHRANQVYALTTHQLQVERRDSHRANQVYAHHTPDTGGDER